MEQEPPVLCLDRNRQSNHFFPVWGVGGGTTQNGELSPFLPTIGYNIPWYLLESHAEVKLGPKYVNSFQTVLYLLMSDPLPFFYFIFNVSILSRI